MNKQRAHIARHAGRTGRLAASSPARRRPVLVLGVVMATVLMLAVILAVALSHGTTAPGTPANTASGAGTPFVPPAQALPGVDVLDTGSGLTAPAAKAAAVGQPAPVFAWQTATGQASLSTLRGHPVL